MGVVYLGQSADDGLVAVKVVHEGLSYQPEFRVRFAREVRALERVSGPFTAGILGYDVDAAQPWVAMQYVPGPTLDEAVRVTGALPADQVGTFAVGLAAAIDSLHRAGLVHRDLKPGNVILSPDGPVIVDLGIAQAVDATALTVTGQTVGTFAWMAPEQLHGQDATSATDMFAWACLVLLAATGEHPFGIGRPEAVALRIMTGEPDTAGIGHLDEPLRVSVARALAKDPEVRPSAPEVLRAMTPTDAAGDTLLDQAASTVRASWAPTQALADLATTIVTRPEGNAEGSRESLEEDPSELQGSTPPAGRRIGASRVALAAVLILGVVGVSVAAVQGLGNGDGSGSLAAPSEASASASEVPTREPESPTPSAEDSTTSASPTRTPSPSNVVVGETTDGMDLESAMAAAQADSCDTCVDLTYAPAAARESARRGLVEFGVSAPDGRGGYVQLWAFSDQGWQPLIGYQDEVPMPRRLPDEIWICTDSSSTNVRSGPGTQYPVVANVQDDTPVYATYMYLTEPQTRLPDWVDGEGWFEVASDTFNGWVTSSRVADEFLDCSRLQAYQQ